MSEIPIHHNSAIFYNKNDNKIMKEVFKNYNKIIKEAFPQKNLFLGRVQKYLTNSYTFLLQLSYNRIF